MTADAGRHGRVLQSGREYPTDLGRKAGLGRVPARALVMVKLSFLHEWNDHY